MQGRAASSERSEQRCFEIMNMNATKHSYSLLMRPANFSAEKIFQNFFSKIFHQIFSAENFFTIFFSRIFSGIFFHNFFLQNFQRNIFPASLSGIQELNLSGYPFHLTKAFFFFWSRRRTFSIRKIF